MVPTDQTLRDFLLAQSPVWLTERLLRAAQDDRVLLAGLQVAASGGDGSQLVRRELDRAIWVADVVEDEDAATYVHGVGRRRPHQDRLAAGEPARERCPVRELTGTETPFLAQQQAEHRGRGAHRVVPSRRRPDDRFIVAASSFLRLPSTSLGRTGMLVTNPSGEEA